MRLIRLIASILLLGLLALPYAIAENYYTPQDRSFHLNNELLDQSFILTNENFDASYLLEGRQPSAPGWVLKGSGAPASIDCDFANHPLCWMRGVGYVPFTTAFAFLRTTLVPLTNLFPSSASGFNYTTFPAINGTPRIVPGSGILIENGRTNYLTSSTAPATQTTGTLPATGYTLWVNGSGSATMSAGTATGCGTGTASQGSSLTVTITVSGTCNVTVSGSLNAFQLENNIDSVNVGTSLIVTAGATAIRNADVLAASPAMLQYFKNPAGTFLIAASACQACPTAGTQLFQGPSQSGIFSLSNTTMDSRDYGNANDLNATLGSSTTFSNPFVVGLSWSSVTGRALVGNAGTVVTNTHTLVSTTPSSITFAGSGKFYSYVSRITIWNYQLSNWTLQGLT